MRRSDALAAVVLAGAFALLLVAGLLSASTIWWATTISALALVVFLGSWLTIPPAVWRRMILAVNLFFGLWTLATELRYLGVLPHLPWWTLLNVSFLGLLLHFVWWIIADVLLGLFWLVNRLAYGLRTRPA